MNCDGPRSIIVEGAPFELTLCMFFVCLFVCLFVLPPRNLRPAERVYFVIRNARHQKNFLAIYTLYRVNVK